MKKITTWAEKQHGIKPKEILRKMKMTHIYGQFSAWVAQVISLDQIEFPKSLLKKKWTHLEIGLSQNPKVGEADTQVILVFWSRQHKNK